MKMDFIIKIKNMNNNMKNIFKNITTKKLRESVTSAIERMPLAVLFSVLGFIIVATKIAFSDVLSNAIDDILGKSIITLIVMFILSVAVYLFSESVHSGRVTIWRNQLFTMIFGLLFYTFFEENLFSNFYAESFVYIAMTIVGTLAAVFIAPFIKKEFSQRKFYIFTYDTVLTIIMAGIVGFVTTILGFLAYWALDTLFGLPHSFDDFYAYWSAFASLLLAPVFFIINLGSAEVNENVKIEENKFFAFLIKYISLPAITIYFLILYAYSIKVLANFNDWPNGKVAWMVIGFSVFGYFVYSAAYIFTNTIKKDFAPAVIFRKFFPFFVLPQIVMLFYAIGLRINQYDMTINRYFVLAFGIWLTLISFHFIFSKKKYLGVIPMSLIAMIIIVSVGPWSVYSLPEARQLKQLKENMIQANIMQKNGTIKPLEKYTDIDAKLSGKIYGGIAYLCEYHGCSVLDDVFANEIAEIKAKDREIFNKRKIEGVKWAEDEYSPMNTWALRAELTKYLKVRAIDIYRSKQNIQKTITYTQKSNKRHESSIDVKGYDYYLRLDSEFNIPFIEPRLFGADINTTENKNSIDIAYNALLQIEKGVLEIYKFNKSGEKELVDIISMKGAFAKILQHTDEYSEYGSRLLDTENMTFTLYGSKIKVHIVLYDISMPNPEWKGDDALENVDVITKDQRTIPIDVNGGRYYASGYVLLKML